MVVITSLSRSKRIAFPTRIKKTRKPHQNHSICQLDELEEDILLKQLKYIVLVVQLGNVDGGLPIHVCDCAAETRQNRKVSIAKLKEWDIIKFYMKK